MHWQSGVGKRADCDRHPRPRCNNDFPPPTTWRHCADGSGPLHNVVRMKPAQLRVRHRRHRSHTVSLGFPGDVVLLPSSHHFRKADAIVPCGLVHGGTSFFKLAGMGQRHPEPYAIARFALRWSCGVSRRTQRTGESFIQMHFVRTLKLRHTQQRLFPEHCQRGPQRTGDQRATVDNQGTAPGFRLSRRRRLLLGPRQLAANVRRPDCAPTMIILHPPTILRSHPARENPRKILAMAKSGYIETAARRTLRRSATPNGYDGFGRNARLWISYGLGRQRYPAVMCSYAATRRNLSTKSS